MSERWVYRVSVRATGAGLLTSLMLGCLGEPLEGVPEDGEATTDGEAPAPLASAIIGGRPDTNHPTAVALLCGGQCCCSGTLVAPRVVATAARCIITSRGQHPPTAVLFGTTANRSSVPATTVRVIARQPHPRFSGHRQAGWAYESGLLALESTPPCTPTPTAPWTTVPWGERGTTSASPTWGSASAHLPARDPPVIVMS
jgi:hypothetical protein